MNTLSSLIAVVSVLVATITFFHYNAYLQASRDAKLLRVLEKLPSESIECPNHFRIYHVTNGENTYSIHIETKSDGRDVLRLCRKRGEDARPALKKGEEIVRYAYIGSSVSMSAIETACKNFVYDEVQRDPITPVDQKNVTDPASISLLSGIYPGTLWCGIGNLANDIHSQLGSAAETDKCCRAHDMCRPSIIPFDSKFDQRNIGLAAMAYCSCDFELYNCFRRQHSPVADNIANIFFNLLAMKCFEFGLKEICKWQVFGFCLDHAQRCVAITRDNVPY